MSKNTLNTHDIYRNLNIQLKSTNYKNYNGINFGGSLPCRFQVMIHGVEHQSLCPIHTEFSVYFTPYFTNFIILLYLIYQNIHEIFNLLGISSSDTRYPTHANEQPISHTHHHSLMLTSTHLTSHMCTTCNWSRCLSCCCEDMSDLSTWSKLLARATWLQEIHRLTTQARHSITLDKQCCTFR